LRQTGYLTWIIFEVVIGVGISLYASLDAKPFLILDNGLTICAKGKLLGSC